MKRTIILTETDIRNMVIDTINEMYGYDYINEGKWHDRACVAATLAGMLGTVHLAGTHKDELTAPPDPTKHNVLRDVFFGHNDELPPDTVKYDANQQPVSRLQSQTIKHINRAYEASADLIDYIKKYETFHEGWKDDKFGNPTTGWGFIQTPELLKRWPNGLHQTKDENGNLVCPEADEYLLYYIETTTDDFISKTPNIGMLPQRVKDALYDLYYNIGADKYVHSKNLQKALRNYKKTGDLQAIIDNMRYAKSDGKVVKGLQYRSTDRQDMALNGDYNREQYKTLQQLKQRDSKKQDTKLQKHVVQNNKKPYDE